MEHFQNYVDEISHGFEMGVENHELKYRDKKMITSGNHDNLILTGFGTTVLENIQRKNMKEQIQIWVPTGALVITTATLIFSTLLHLENFH